jgi:hypothetical protein
LGAIGGLRSTDVAAARQVETRMDDFRKMMEGQSPAADATGHGAPGAKASLPSADAIDLRAPSEPTSLVLPTTTTPSQP